MFTETPDISHGFTFARVSEMLINRFDTNCITSTIIGCAIRVHRTTGPGLLESADTPCLVYELRQATFSISLQHPLPLVYRGIELEISYRADMLVEDLVQVELKSVESLASIHTAQILTYLKLLKKPVGLLINVNVPVLKDGIKRVVNPELLHEPRPDSQEGRVSSTDADALGAGLGDAAE